MMRKRYLVELGSGVDMHGGDCTKAATRALRDAISHCSMVGLRELAGVTNYLKEVQLEVILSAPDPASIDLDQVRAALPPYEHVDIRAESGGLTVPGNDPITVANAAVIIWVEVP